MYFTFPSNNDFFNESLDIEITFSVVPFSVVIGVTLTGEISSFVTGIGSFFTERFFFLVLVSCPTAIVFPIVRKIANKTI